MTKSKNGVGSNQYQARGSSQAQSRGKNAPQAPTGLMTQVSGGEPPLADEEAMNVVNWNWAPDRDDSGSEDPPIDGGYLEHPKTGEEVEAQASANGAWEIRRSDPAEGEDELLAEGRVDGHPASGWNDPNQDPGPGMNAAKAHIGRWAVANGWAKRP